MEVMASNPHAKAAALFHVDISPTKTNNVSISYKNLNNFTPKPQIQTELPLHKPEYSPPKPIITRSPIKKSSPKPVTTTSDILRLMDSLKLPIPLDIYTSLIKECTELGDPLKAIELHQHMRRSRLPWNLPLLNRVLLMYVSSGCYENARQLFDQMAVRDFSSWAVVIAGCVENGEHEEAVKFFIKMLREEEFENVGDKQMGFSVSGILVCVLKACVYTNDLELGKQVHGWLWKMGCSQSDVLSSFLIRFYGKLKCFEDALSVFEQVSCQNTAVWTSRIVNCCSGDHFEEGIRVFKGMGREGVRKNGYTFSAVLKACRMMGDVVCGQQVHANVMKLGLESDGFVQSALVDLYGKCGVLNDATRAFEISRNKRNAASYNAILTNYMQHGFCIEAIKILYEMKGAGIIPYESVSNELRIVCGGRIREHEMDGMYVEQ